MNINQLLLTLTDPALENLAGMEQECKYLFEQGYIQFTKQRLELNDRMRDDDQYRFVFEENLMYLTKEYYVRWKHFKFHAIFIRVCTKTTKYRS